MSNLSSLSYLDQFFGPAVPRYSGTDLPKRGAVEYIGSGVSVADDPVNQRTQVTIATGGGAPPAGTGIPYDVSGAWGTTIANGTVGQILTMAGGVPAWVTPTVNGAAVPAAGSLVTGNGPYVSGSSALTYSALNLAGGAGWVTGVLPVGNQTPPSVAMGALPVDWSASGVFTKTLSAGSNLISFANTLDGQTVTVILTGAASTVTWPAGIKWPGGTVPTQTSSGVDAYTFVKAGTTIYGSAAQALA